MENNKKIYSTAVVSKISMTFLGVITSALINRLLGVSLKGEYAYIVNCVTIFLAVLSIGLGQTYSTYRRKYGPEILGTFVGLAIIQTGITLILFVIAFLLNANFYIKSTLLLSVLSVFKNNIIYIAAIEDIKKRDTNNIKYKIIYTIVISIIYLLKWKSLYGMLFVYMLEDIIILIGTFKTYKFKPNFNFIKENNISIFKIYKFGFISMLMLLMITLNYNLDTIFLKKMASSESVGLYSIAISLANMLWLIPDAFKDVMFSKTAKDDHINEIVIVTKYSIYFSAIIVIGFAIFGKIFIKIMYGSEYVGAYGATLLLFIGCISMVIYKIIHPLYISKGKQWRIFLILMCSVISNIILNCIMIPKMDIYGAASSSVFSYSLCSIIFLIMFCKEYNVQYKNFIFIGVNDVNYIKNVYKSFKKRGKKN